MSVHFVFNWRVVLDGSCSAWSSEKDISGFPRINLGTIVVPHILSMLYIMYLLNVSLCCLLMTQKIFTTVHSANDCELVSVVFQVETLILMF